MCPGLGGVSRKTMILRTKFIVVAFAIQISGGKLFPIFVTYFSLSTNKNVTLLLFASKYFNFWGI